MLHGFFFKAGLGTPKMIGFHSFTVITAAKNSRSKLRTPPAATSHREMLVFFGSLDTTMISLYMVSCLDVFEGSRGFVLVEVFEELKLNQNFVVNLRVICCKGGTLKNDPTLSFFWGGN